MEAFEKYGRYMELFTRFKKRNHIKTAQLMKYLSLDFLHNIIYDTLPKIGVSIDSVYLHEILIYGICIVKYTHSTLHCDLQNTSKVIEEYHKIMEDYLRNNFLVKKVKINDANIINKLLYEIYNTLNIRFIEYSNTFLDDIDENLLLKKSIELLAEYCFVDQIKGDKKRSFIVFVSTEYVSFINKCIRILK